MGAFCPRPRNFICPTSSNAKTLIDTWHSFQAFNRLFFLKNHHMIFHQIICILYIIISVALKKRIIIIIKKKFNQIGNLGLGYPIDYDWLVFNANFGSISAISWSNWWKNIMLFTNDPSIFGKILFTNDPRIFWEKKSYFQMIQEFQKKMLFSNDPSVFRKNNVIFKWSNRFQKKMLKFKHHAMIIAQVVFWAPRG